MIAEPVRRYLERRQARYHTVPHEARFSAQEAAETAHVSGKHFAKAVLLKRTTGNGTPSYLLAVLPAHEKVSLDRLAKRLGEPVTLGSEEEAARLFPDIEVGALPPLGELAGIPVIADGSLRHAEWIVFHGGVLTELVEMTWVEYDRIAHPRLMDYARLPAGPGEVRP